KGAKASLTGFSNGALPDQDGVALASGDLLLVWKQENAIQNGVYSVNQGNASGPYFLQRYYLSAQKADFNAQVVEVTGGIMHSRRLFFQQTISPLIGTSGISYHPGLASKNDWPPRQALLLSFLH